MSTDLRMRLAKLDEQIIELEQARATMKSELYATAKYPVVDLPTEVTQKIFLQCHRVFDPLRIPSFEHSAPIVLSSVCQTWREAAVGTPELWSSLVVLFDDIVASGLKPGVVEGIIELWLARASDRPLSLGFESYTEDGPFTLSRWRGILHRWSPQIHDLDLFVGRLDLGQLGLDLASFPLLQKASIRGGVSDPSQIFLNAPRLHDLCLVTASQLTSPWAQLTKFEGTISDLTLFTVAPNLTELICSFECDSDDLEIVTHSHLRSLTISETEEVSVLQYLTLPALKRLDISDSPAYGALQSFFERSLPPLTELVLHGEQACLESWDEFTPLVADTLESLHIKNSLTTAFFVYPILDSLPNVRSLTFEKFTEDLDLNSLVRFLYAQSGNLRIFNIIYGPSHFFDCDAFAGFLDGEETVDTVNRHLARLVQSGMDVYFGTKEKNYLRTGYAGNSIPGNVRSFLV
ncbi:hypothetical protein R3P38DRAFT_2833761 [Favolaschia claudopus]|uniref:F-box domain-containing protein n=1 Tax=Favolaschia claudopus TaxID=2862362 RepID=A0AAW0ED24_9AGAR